MPRNVHDIEWLGLELTSDALGATLTVQERHLSPVERLYGGVAVAAAVTLMEEVTGGSVGWITVQFATSCNLGDVIDLRVAVSAAGRRTSQLRVTGTVGAREVFVAVGAARARREEPDSAGQTVRPDSVGQTVRPDSAGQTVRPDLSGQWLQLPDVPPPDDCPRLAGPIPQAGGYLELTEYRVALPPGDPPSPHIALWCRPVSSGPLSAAILGWQADLLGLAFVAPLATGPATSLDNTVRFGAPADPLDDWILADLHGQLAASGLGHGTVDLWSPSGALLATASQSCILHRPT